MKRRRSGVTDPRAWGFLASAYFLFAVLAANACGACGYFEARTAAAPRVPSFQDATAIEIRVFCLTGSPFDGNFTGGGRGGSGFLISGTRALTALHVVDCALPPLIFVQLADGREFRAVVERQWDEDVARLRLIGDAGVYQAPAIGFIDEGAPVCAVTGTPTREHHCGLVEHVDDMIEFGADVYHGNSGGALYGADGKLVGIVRAGLFAANTIPMGIGFAVPMRAEYLR